MAFQWLVQTIQRFTEWNFSPRITLTGTKDSSVFPQLCAQIASHSQTHNIMWTQRSGSLTSAGTLDIDYSDSPFVILSLGKVSQDKMSHVLYPLQSATYSLTNKKLASTLKKFSHPNEPDCILLAICKPFFILRNLIADIYSGPRWRNIQVLDPSTGILHTCAPRRIMDGYRSADINESVGENPGCKPSCRVPSVSCASLI